MLVEEDDADLQAAQLRELRTVMNLSHPYLLTCFTWEQAEINGMDFFGLVMELATGDLEKYLDQRGALPETEVMAMLTGWADALHYLHSQNPVIVHRDLKPANILRVGNCWKVGDLGIAREIAGKTKTTQNCAGSPAYMPPDAYEGKISPAFDLWSLGVILVNLLTDELPFMGTPYELQAAVMGKPPRITKSINSPLKEIIDGCLQKERAQRWTAQRVRDYLIASQQRPATTTAPTIRVPSPYRQQFAAPARSSDYQERLANGVILEMIAIPGGSFLMGSPQGEGDDDEEPQHRVTVPAFYMGKYPITQAQYQAVMGNNPATQYDADRFVGPQKPVVGVSWEDAKKFCQKLSRDTGKVYRLPSEAEWEYACRAGTDTPFYFGQTITPDQANYDWRYAYGSGPKRDKWLQCTTPVGKFPANAFGLYDMHGNVWEWCEDVWHNNYEGAPTDGSAWVTRDSSTNARLLRGGSWDNVPGNCRSANRGWRRADRWDNGNGFRVVLGSAARTP